MPIITRKPSPQVSDLGYKRFQLIFRNAHLLPQRAEQSAVLRVRQSEPSRNFGYIAPNKVCRINEDIYNIYDKALNNIALNQSINTGCNIPKSVSKRYSDVFGYDCTDAKISLNTGNIRHIEKNIVKGMNQGKINYQLRKMTLGGFPK